MGFWNRATSYMKRRKYAVFVLCMVTLAYLINQLDTFCLIATNASMAQELEYGDWECEPENEKAMDDLLGDAGENDTAMEFCDEMKDMCNEAGFTFGNTTEPCYRHYLGRGLEYQLLAGPLYIVLFSISGVPMGLASELNNINRKGMLAGCVVLFSIMTVLGGFATEYWHAAICRLLLGIFSAGCVPFSASLITDYFPQEERAAAMGFFTWGIFVGYSITYLLIIAERDLGWRAVYWIAGTPGIIVGIIIALTVRDPPRSGSHDTSASWKKLCSQLKEATKYFCGLTLLLLSLGGAVRNGAGIVWAYNLVLFFDEYHPGTNIEAWMSWIPLIFGSLSAIGGGYIADRWSANKGLRGRLIILVGCLLLSAPFQAMVLTLPMPWAFISHIPGYLFGEMWLGICFAVVVELVPANLSTSSIAVFFFIIQIIGGNMNLLVTPITNSLDMRWALLITFPGFYVIGAIIFAFTLMVVWKKDKTSFDLDDLKDIEITVGSADDMYMGSGIDSEKSLVPQSENNGVAESKINTDVPNSQSSSSSDLKTEKF